MLDALRQDLRFALRQLGRSPGFTAVAALTLALGIGANTGVFSVLRAAVLQPLPFARPDRLVVLQTRYLPSSGLDIPWFPLSAPEVEDYRDQSRTLQDVVPWTRENETLVGREGAPVQLRVGQVGRGMFRLLGVDAALGRTFAPEEEEPSASPTTVLSYSLWKSRFGGDPEVVGRTISLDGANTRVVGVMPRGFEFPSAQVAAWRPLGLDENRLPPRGAHFLVAVGRLRPGATLAQAQAEQQRIREAWSERFQHYAMGHYVYVTPLRTLLVGDVGHVLWTLMAAVGLVLLIACVNVANLLLARTERRHRELSVRAALGAGRLRLIGQLLVEGLVLSAVGGAAGLLLAAWGTRALVAVDPGAIPRSGHIHVDMTVLLFTLGLTVVTALVFGILPAFQSTSGRLAGGLVSGSRIGSGRRRTAFRRGLVATEVAVSLVVVVAAALLLRSFWRLTSVDPGVESRNVLTFGLSLPQAGYPEAEQVPAFYEQLLRRLESLPGVRSASAATSLPVADDPPRADFRVEGEPPPAEGVPAWNADAVAVEPGYFRTMGIPVLRGRVSGSGDRAGTELVAVVNRALVRRYWPGESPIGRRIGYAAASTPDDSVAWIRIVGVVGDTRVGGLDAEPRPEVFLPHDQLRLSQGSTGRSTNIVLRTDLPPLRLLPAAREAVAELDPRLPLVEPRTMHQVLGRSVARPRMMADLLGGFGLIALLLASVGVYGVMAYTVSLRTREIGIRMALGARAGQVLRLVLAQSLRPVILGVSVGVVAALAGTRLLASQLFGISPADPVSYAAVALLLGGAAALACWIPARRAARVDPARALRIE
jgi:putative ABC transport system permease protein